MTSILKSNPRLRKVLRDLWENKQRTGLVLLALIIGIFAVGSVLTAYTILSPEMARNFNETLPPDAVLGIPNADTDLAAEVASWPTIESAAVSRTVVARMEREVNEWFPIILFVLDSFEAREIGRFYAENGRSQPQAGEILLERNSLEVIPQQIGDPLLIQIPNGSKQVLRFAGTIHDPAQAPAWMEGRAYGYVTPETAELLSLPPAFSELQIRFMAKGDRKANQLAANGLAEQLRERGWDIERIQVPEPERHPHADQMEALLFLLGAFGVLALLLSGLLVATMIDALMRRQLPEIGIMKSMGARSTQISQIYTVFVTLLGLLATIPAILLSLWVGRAYAFFAADMLNFTIVHDVPPFWVYGLQVLAAVLIPLISAMIPVRRGSQISVREALDAKGGQPQLNVMNRNIASNRLRARPLLLLAIRNTGRQPKRTLLTLSTLTVGGAIFIAALNIGQSWTNTINRIFETTQADFSIDLFEPQQPEELKAQLLTIENIAIVDIGAKASGTILANGVGLQDVVVVALPPDQQLDTYHVYAGRMLSKPDEIVLSNSVAEAANLTVGDTFDLQIGVKTGRWRVVGLAMADLRTAYVLPKSLQSRYSTNASRQFVMVQVVGHCPVYESCSTSAVTAVIRAVEKKLASQDVRVVSIEATTERYQIFIDHIEIIVNFLVLSALFVATVGSLGLMTSMRLNVLERTREIGVMRSLGADSMAVLKLILWEGVAMGLFSWLLALLLSIPASILLGNIAGRIFLKQPLALALSYVGMASWLGIVMLIALVATALPAVQATETAVSTALAYE